MSLQWVDQGTVGAEARRRIRSHVMKGKNAGRPRPSRKKRDDDSKSNRQHSSLPVSGLESDLLCRAIIRCNHISDSKQLFWNDLALSSFPETPSPQSVGFIHQWFIVTESIYPSTFCSRLDILEYIWYYYIHVDTAYFHSVLAITASFADVFGGRREVSREALGHLSEAYKMVNQKLQGPESVSDTTIATVITLAIYQRVHHQQQTGLIHFYGLLRMIELRGGIETVQKQNRALAQKALRLDIEFALQDGQPTRLVTSRKSPSPDFTRLEVSQTLRSALAILGRYHGVNTTVLNLMYRCTALACKLNKLGTETRLDPLDYSDQILVLSASLLQYAPMEWPHPTNRIEHLIHLSLLVFMTTLLPAYGRDHYQYNLLSTAVERAFMNMHSIVGVDRSIMVWAIFVAKVSVFRNRDAGWILTWLRKSLSHLGLQTWTDVRQMLSQYPWVHTAHDTAGKEYWDKTKEKQ